MTLGTKWIGLRSRLGKTESRTALSPNRRPPFAKECNADNARLTQTQNRYLRLNGLLYMIASCLTLIPRGHMLSEDLREAPPPRSPSTEGLHSGMSFLN